EAGRGDPRFGDERRDRRPDQGSVRQAGEGSGRGEGVSRLRREPTPRPDDERGFQPPPGGRREPGGHRQGDEARDEHADGTVRARGLHGTGYRAGRDGGPVPRDGRPEVPTVAPPEEVRPRGARRPEV